MLSTPQLADELKGQVIEPDDPDYDRARTVFYGTVDRRPAAIVKVADATDVARVIAHARDSGLELAVRSGGHSVAGHGVTEGGVVLDLSDMRALEIDPERRTAWAQTGLTAGEYTHLAARHGLATGFGDTGSVGIGGLTLGGGVGFLVRKHGLTIDDLLAAEVVTADGELVYADAENHRDLFWAIRGGGGNFGVATRLKFRLAPGGRVRGRHPLPARHARRDRIVRGPGPGGAGGAVHDRQRHGRAPAPFVPPEVHGKLVLMGMVAYAGDVQEGERAIAPFRALATPIADLVRPMSYAEMYPPRRRSTAPWRWPARCSWTASAAARRRRSSSGSGPRAR